MGGRFPDAIAQFRSGRVERIAILVERLTFERGWDAVEGGVVKLAAIDSVAAKGDHDLRTRESGPDTQLQPARIKRLEDGGVFGDPDRIFERQCDDSRAET